MATTDNGWPASKTLARRTFAVNGVEFVGGIADNDDVELVLRFVLQRVADRVEQPANPGCWGFAFRPNRNDPDSLSRHSGGIAVDLNAPRHPNGVPTVGTFAPSEIAVVHSILDELDEACGVPAGTRVVRWGGDFNGTPDAMHFEINVSPAVLSVLASRLRDHLEALMPLTDVDVDKVVTALLDTKLLLPDGTEVTVKQALRRTAQYAAEFDALDEGLADIGLRLDTVAARVSTSRAKVMAKLEVIDSQVGAP